MPYADTKQQNFNLTGYYTLIMNDEVNRPDHYNKGGIEVIDVIETYAKTDFRLANVLKYVCRCEYKGRKLQDLEKAAWYLNRVLEEERARLDCEAWEADPANSDWCAEEEHGGYSVHEVEVFFEGYECRKQEEAEIEAALKDESFEVTLPPDRIAGDDAAATRIKDEYYAFNRFEIRGYCASCDAEIGATQPFFRDPNQFDAGLLFCSQQCITSLREWQKVEL